MVAIQDPSLPAWKGLFEWSINNSDGTQASRQPSPEELAWFQEAMAANLQDVAQRMRDIKSQLEKEPGAEAAPTLPQREALLDELMEIVEDINFARDLRGVGGLPTLLTLLADPEPSLRARAAAVLAACGQNNEPVQQWLLNGGALPPLMAQLRDDDSEARTSAYTAVSCLTRHCRPALDVLLEANGLNLLADGLSDASPRVQRKAAQLLAALLSERPELAGSLATGGATGDGGAAAGEAALGASGAAAALPAMLGSGDWQVREAALRLALALAADPRAADALFQAPDFEPALRRLRIALEDAPADDAEANADEAQMAARLAAALRDPAAVASAAAGSRALGGSDGGGGRVGDGAVGGSGGTLAAAGSAAAEQPVLMLGPPR